MWWLLSFKNVLNIVSLPTIILIAKIISYFKLLTIENQYTYFYFLCITNIYFLLTNSVDLCSC